MANSSGTVSAMLDLGHIVHGEVMGMNLLEALLVYRELELFFSRQKTLITVYWLTGTRMTYATTWYRYSHALMRIRNRSLKIFQSLAETSVLVVDILG